MLSINKAVANNLTWLSGISFQAWLYQIRPIFTNEGEKCGMLTVPPRLLLAPGAARGAIPECDPSQEPHRSDPRPKRAPHVWDSPVPQQPRPVFSINLLHTKSQEEGDKDNKTASQGVVSPRDVRIYTPR